MLVNYSLAFLADYGVVATILALVLIAAWLCVEIYQLYPWRGLNRQLAVLLALAASLAISGLVLGPERIENSTKRGNQQWVLLVDDSRRSLLPGDGDKNRHQVAAAAIGKLKERFGKNRISAYRFDNLGLEAWDETQLSSSSAVSSGVDRVAGSLSEMMSSRSAGILLLSDGAWDDGEKETDKEWYDEFDRLTGHLPRHAVNLSSKSPNDRGIAHVSSAGTTIAHEAFTMRVGVRCVADIDCSGLEVSLREHRFGEKLEPLSRVRIPEVAKGEIAEVEFQPILERPGRRVLEIELHSSEADSVAENDHRFIEVDVIRQRPRLLHVAGRPTYDVRALRSWLKSDESVDLVTFFILREEHDDPRAEDDELSLIRFPVDELFDTHLASFDAVFLQDIDAVRYGLGRYFPRLTDYVKGGGGLILIGGRTGLGVGGFGSPGFNEILPAELPDRLDAFETKPFVPKATDIAGQVAVLSEFNRLTHGKLPELPGANTVGPLKSGAVSLWDMPGDDSPKSLLSLREVQDGRVVMLASDGGFRLRYGIAAEEHQGRAFGALWDGLLGWVMHEQRYEMTAVRLASRCWSDQALKLETGIPLAKGIDVNIEILKLGSDKSEILRQLTWKTGESLPEFDALEPGAYSLRSSIDKGLATRIDFACEYGGEAFEEVRPKLSNLSAFVAGTGGTVYQLDELDEIPPIEAIRSESRRGRPLFEPWVWATVSAIVLAGLWFLRRRLGLR